MSNTKIQNNSKKQSYVYWSLLLLLAAFFLISGLGELTKNPSTYLKTLKMGYPPVFIAALGVAKICGVIVLLIPNIKRLKDWAFAGFTFDVIFAFISALSVNNTTDCIKAVIVFGVLILTHSLFVKRDALQKLDEGTILYV